MCVTNCWVLSRFVLVSTVAGCWCWMDVKKKWWRWNDYIDFQPPLLNEQQTAASEEGRRNGKEWQQQTTEPKSQGHDNGRKRSYGRERKPESHTRSRTNTWGHVKWLYTQEDRLWASTSTSSSWTLFATRIMDLLVLLWRLPFRLLDILKTRQDSISLR